MQEYFKLQFDMMNRQLKEMGIKPILGLIILLITVVGGSFLLYSKTTYAPYIIGLIGLTITLRTSEQKRVKHLKSIFNINTFRRIRIVENIIVITPILVVLLFNFEFIIAGITSILTIFMSWYESNQNLSFTIPTPFSRKPFEFSSGFRKTILLLIGIYTLFIISVVVHNFNLGVFCLIILFLTTLSYYSTPEEKLFVWIFNDTERSFLSRKIGTSILFSGILTLPISITLLVLNPEHYFVIAVFTLLGFTSLITMVIAKYAAYPSKMNIAQGLIFSIGIVFPPLLLAVIPYFYSQAKGNLNELLK